MRHLLKESHHVLALFDGNHFPQAPPRYVRLEYYKYSFTTPETKRATGAWWTRQHLGNLTITVSLPTLHEFETMIKYPHERHVTIW